MNDKVKGRDPPLPPFVQASARLAPTLPLTELACQTLLQEKSFLFYCCISAPPASWGTPVFKRPPANVLICGRWKLQTPLTKTLTLLGLGPLPPPPTQNQLPPVLPSHSDPALGMQDNSFGVAR